MQKKWIRIGNNFYNLDKVISVESDLDNNKLTFTFDGGVEKTIERKDSTGFNLFIFNPICHAIEDGDFDWKPSEETLKQYRNGELA